MISTALARFGGDPAVPPQSALEGLGAWPDVQQSDVRAVEELLRGTAAPWGFLHPAVAAFSAAIGGKLGCTQALPVASGTAALHLAVASLSLEPGTKVLTSVLGYVASAACILHHQCVPVFADVDPVTFNLSPASVRKHLSSDVGAILAVDLLGLPADYDALRSVTSLPIVEDASHSIGASYHGRPAGSLGDISGASLMATKVVPSCGEAGVVATDREDLYARVLDQASLGMRIWDAAGPLPIAHDLGFNYRPSPINLAFAQSQLRRADMYQGLRQQRVRQFEQGLAGISFLDLPQVPAGLTSTHYMYRARVLPEALELPAHWARHLRDALVFLASGEGGIIGFWEEELMVDMPLFRAHPGSVKHPSWRFEAGTDIEYDGAIYPHARAVLDSYFMPMIARATHSEAFVAGQVRVYQKLAEHRESLRDVTKKIAEAGGFEQLVGVPIRQLHAARQGGGQNV